MARACQRLQYRASYCLRVTSQEEQCDRTVRRTRRASPLVPGPSRGIVARIEGLLNAQRKPPSICKTFRFSSRHFEDCFFTLAGLAPEHSRLRRQLDEAHWASGFKPRQAPGQHNDLIDPAEMMSRAF